VTTLPRRVFTIRAPSGSCPAAGGFSFGRLLQFNDRIDARFVIVRR
jgi:hypothetical protein